MNTSGNMILPNSRRLADLDSKLNGIIARLSNTTHVADSAISSGTTTSHSTTDEPCTTSASPEIESTKSISGHDQVRQCILNDKSGALLDNNWARRLNLDLAYITHLLQEFRYTQHFFPFVVIPDTWSVPFMLRERPFLLLAAITTVARDTPSIQEMLANEVKSVLAKRIVIDGENNIDLLQGLLVHLAWCDP